MKVSVRARLLRRSIPAFVKDIDTPLPERRAAMERIDRLPRPRKVDYRDTTVGGVPAIVATPTAVPVERHILYLHGGGYVVGSPRTHIAFAARLAKRARAAVSVIDYRLAPENPYPAAIEDCVAAYRGVLEHTDPTRVTIAGDSAGGGATLATLCALRDSDTPLPAAGYLISPWTDLTGQGESTRTKAAVDPMLDPGWLTHVASRYAGGRPLDHSGLSPLFADLTGLPPLLVQVGSDEVLLSDSTRLVQRARAAGVMVDLDVRDDMWHVYQAFAGMMPEATIAVIEAAGFIRAKSPAEHLVHAAS
jgi:acetyl esterase/lipase